MILICVLIFRGSYDSGDVELVSEEEGGAAKGGASAAAATTLRGRSGTVLKPTSPPGSPISQHQNGGASPRMDSTSGGDGPLSSPQSSSATVIELDWVRKLTVPYDVIVAETPRARPV